MPSPFSLPPLYILVKRTSENTTRVHHIQWKKLSITLPIQMKKNILFHLYLSLNSLTMVMTALPRRETGQGLQFTEEDWVWIPLASQLSILNQTIFPQVVLSHK